MGWLNVEEIWHIVPDIVNLVVLIFMLLNYIFQGLQKPCRGCVIKKVCLASSFVLVVVTGRLKVSLIVRIFLKICICFHFPSHCGQIN